MVAELCFVLLLKNTEKACKECLKNVSISAVICWNCGQLLDGETSEEEAIRYYFKKGFEYKDILSLLQKDHGILISYNTLLRRFKKYGLLRRFKTILNNQHVDVNLLDTVRQRISELMSGLDSNSGYRTIWHKLKGEGLFIPRIYVQNLLKEIDPEGSELRKRYKLKRREYICTGPNSAWHMDGYDKMKPWGFPIHGAIDGYSRKLLWLKVLKSNNSPDRILSLYYDAVQTCQGCPSLLVTDLGTENGLAAAAQCYFRDNPDAHRYVPSPRNQRIESWWSQYSKQQSIWWRQYFKSMETNGKYNGTNDLHKEALWYCFSPIIQNDLDSLKSNWNSHYIRRSRFDTIAGRPDILYSLPENYGAENSKP